jgi:hypothetical protein
MYFSSLCVYTCIHTYTWIKIKSHWQISSGDRGAQNKDFEIMTLCPEMLWFNIMECQNP